MYCCLPCFLHAKRLARRCNHLAGRCIKVVEVQQLPLLSVIASDVVLQKGTHAANQLREAANSPSLDGAACLSIVVFVTHDEEGGHNVENLRWRT